MDSLPDIDRGELAQQLALKGYNDAFEHMQFELMGRFSTELWQLKLVGRHADKLPVLVVKKPYKEDRSGESAELEALLYERLAAELPVVVPGFIGRQDDMLILEKIPNLEHFDFKTGPQGRHAELAMDGYAALHAAMWNKTGHLTWLPQLSDVSLRQSFQSDFDLGWETLRKELHKLCPAFTPIGDALVGRLAKTLAPLACPRTLLHGDGHAENLPMTSAGAIVFLDWQAPRVGNPGFDIAIFMAMSYPTPFRRAVEARLVRRHYESVRARGIDWPDPVADFRLGLLRRAARIVEIAATGTFSSFSWVFQRCATAAADHRVGDLII